MQKGETVHNTFSGRRETFMKKELQTPTPVDLNLFNQLKADLKKSYAIKIKITSDSMEPLIKVGDTLSVLFVDDFEQISPFDIIVFWNGSFLACHFVSYKNQVILSSGKKVLTTRGLANRQEDIPIDESQILGIVKGRRISNWLRFKCLLFRR